MKVKDIMTQNVASLEPKDSVERAAQLMKEHDIGALPVCDNNNVIGIITDRDIVLRTISEGKSPKSVSVREVMTSNPVIGRPDMNVEDATRIMGERQIRRLPVVEENTMVGIVSLGDLAVEPRAKSEANETLKEISEPCSPNI
ncbi:CBS domain-containing protein [Desnuesiella massiliensis]|uniref:CBS domain-containing protein n=1 Tax=Desnuesiella massiliensis TaxID=1650662 RepID=UPI0006E290F7|nr:CBS domain-containing protein [Desnuesiella massiliensis]